MQKVADFTKDVRTRVVMANDPSYYIEIKKQRSDEAWKTEINTRLTELEKQVSLIKELLRGRQ